MTEYNAGDKVLIEATILRGEPDGDNELLVRIPDGESSYIKVDKVRPITAAEVETTPIAFGDIKVGDTVRHTITFPDAVEATLTGFVTRVLNNRFEVGAGHTLWSDTVGTIELISRPEPEPIKVGDAVNVEQVRTLPVGSLVDYHSAARGKSRVVSQGGLYNPEDNAACTALGWSTYTGEMFTVKYIVGE